MANKLYVGEAFFICLQTPLEFAILDLAHPATQTTIPLDILLHDITCPLQVLSFVSVSSPSYII